MKFYSLLVLGLASLLLTTTVQSGEYTDQVKAQFALVRMVAQNEGWRETHDNMFGNLRSGQTKTYNLTLRSGMSYKLIGACDNDCSDLDLFLYRDGVKVADDAKTDGLPIVEFNPRRTRQFKLKARMYTCRRNPCYYGIMILGKRAR